MKTHLVLISGLLSNDRVWQHQVKNLSTLADIQIFNPCEDTPAKMVKGILDKAPPTFALAGHSMGGWLCLEIFRADPSRVSKVCLLNTSARSDFKEKKAKRKSMIEQCKAGKFPEIAGEVASFFTSNSQTHLEVEKMFLKVGEDAFIAQEQAMLMREPCEKILPIIHCPALVIHAAQDKNFSLEEHAEMVEQMPNAKLAVVEDSGHMSPMERPQAVTALLRYWLTYF
jgi:pimeloyl-ACP methyl ester carboxylesterase